MGHSRRESWNQAAQLAAVAWCLLLSIVVSTVNAGAASVSPDFQRREQLIRVLGTTMDRNQKPAGVVIELIIGLRQRDDHDGLEVQFSNGPGRFSITTQTAARSAIMWTAKASGLESDSWSVYLSVPNPTTTIYGESLSAMVGLTVVALAKGDFVPPDRVITGTVTRAGMIGAVSGIHLKLQAARDLHLTRVLVPEVYDITDGDWQTPFLLQVSPVDTVGKAYQALIEAKDGG
jgi:predicted S18 family serine protease